MPPGATVTVQPWAGRDEGPLLNTGFQVEFGGTFAGLDIESLVVTGTGATGFVGEKVRGGLVQNRGFFITPTGNHAPEVTTTPAYTIPLRTPFALTGSATDADNDALTYMWEQNDIGGATGTALVSNTKKDGPLFRQFGTAAQVSATDTLLSPSPGEWYLSESSAVTCAATPNCRNSGPSFLTLSTSAVPVAPPMSFCSHM